VTHPGGQTGHPTLPFDATPCDGRLRQRVERVTFQGRAPGRENHQHRLVRHTPKLGAGGVTSITISPPRGSKTGTSIARQRRIHVLLPAEDSARQIRHARESDVGEMRRRGSAAGSALAVQDDLSVAIERVDNVG